MIVGSYHFGPLGEAEYASLQTTHGPQRMKAIATYRICQIVMKPFQTKVRKNEDIVVQCPPLFSTVKSTVAKNRWVAVVAWAKVKGTTLKERKRLKFELDTHNLELVECGDTGDWDLGQPDTPIVVQEELSRSSFGRFEFTVTKESHDMIQTMDNPRI